MTRNEARERLMQALYRADMRGDFILSPTEEAAFTEALSGQRTYFYDLYKLLQDHVEEIDRLIQSYSGKWDLERIPKTDLAILRLAVCEILFYPAVPPAVSINEAVELGKKYGTENSPSYINGILGNIVRQTEATV